MNQNDRHWRWATPQTEGAAADPSLLPPVVTRRDRLKSAVADRLPATLRGRWGLDRTTGIVLAVSVLLGALLIGGWAVLRARPHEMSVARERPLGAAPGSPDMETGPTLPGVPVATDGAGAASGMLPGYGTAVGPASTSTSSPGVIVDVEGKVAKPGVRTLPTGSRVLDALNAAGGALPGTDLTALNQAQVLVDGQQVLVGVTPPPQAETGAPSGRGKKSRGRAGVGGAQPVHLNTAGVEDLEQLPGVGPALAQRIVDFRTEHGPFHSVDDLRQVSGFGGQRFANLAPMVAL
ncbi:ComEA family DNA-binding protein [Actinospica sp. MGRD01-02]|uniref:ComEA family DNA-binding protein n=1 Tax=Actinospica acidithermotolerans TaxID=2828514 RepID=A0A941E9C9_9ACTN|nr:ComEA family DNA-binding protein [Actinospica acidithermotolerans]MBR7828680.1 ComEA family DNA-binding protein [Actinospica acidithermotolerans]